MSADLDDVVLELKSIRNKLDLLQDKSVALLILSQLQCIEMMLGKIELALRTLEK